MGLPKFLNGFKKHQKYFYLSLILIAGFFIGSALITPKITSVTESLIENIIEENLKSKKNSIAFEFNRLNSFLVYAEDLISGSSGDSLQNLKEKLLVTTDLARSTEMISNSFIYAIGPQGVEEIRISQENKALTVPGIGFSSKQWKSLADDTFVDTIIKTPQHVINRKMYVKKFNAETTVVVGYDIDLLDFWKYFSEKYPGGSGYTVVTTQEGICVLHPEPEFIGRRLDGYFEAVSRADIFQQAQRSSLPESAAGRVLKHKATSEFLGVEVLRYFDTVKIGETSLIIVESFPVDIIVKETIQEVQDYFTWISLLAFISFTLLLLVSRVQLKREYRENLKVLEEKERLVNANEKYQKENAVLQLNQLKKKMNPHFLFNSLNSLHVLIETDPEVSQEFVLRLADVYRYFLENKEGDLTTVKKEISFLEKYVFLQEIRFKSSLNVSIVNKGGEQVLSRKIPFLALETLIENAIKHNQITRDNPLHLEIIINEEAIVVSNNYTPRKNSTESHKLGLKYLENSYSFHNVNGFQAGISDAKFQVVLPFLG